MWKVSSRKLSQWPNQFRGRPPLQAVLLEGQQPEAEAAMQAAGFSRAHYEPRSCSLRLVSWDGPGSKNSLWVRDFGFVEERCRTARAVTVAGVSF
jgi:endo-1,4-beta-mannosidase